MLTKSAPDPENDTTHDTKSHRIATTGTNGKANQPLRRHTKDSDTAPSGYLKPRAKLSYGEPHMLYDGSPSDTPRTAMRITPAQLTPTQPPVLDQGNSTKQKEGAKPLSRRKPRKSTPLMGEPPLQVLERQAKLEIVLPSTSKRQRRRRQHAQLKTVAYANLEEKAVIERTEKQKK